MAGNTAAPGQTVASRVMSVLAAFDERHRTLTLTEIATRSGLPRPTAHRIIADLVEWGALLRNDTGGYVVGRRLWELGLLAPNQSGLREIASPFLQDIYGATLATVHLAVRDGDRALYLDRVSGHRSVPIVSRIGSRLPLHATGVGKVLLAYAPSDVQERVLGNLTRVTARTVTHRGHIENELRRVHRDGFAQTVEEMSLGACSVAVPVRNSDGSVEAAIGMVVPSLSRDRPRLVAALAVAARGIGRNLPTRSRS